MNQTKYVEGQVQWTVDQESWVFSMGAVSFLEGVYIYSSFCIFIVGFRPVG